MIFLIVTHVCHKQFEGDYFAYGPYIREMNLWIKYTDSVIILAPIEKGKIPDAIDLAYNHPDIHFISIPQFNIRGARSLLRTLYILPVLIFKIAQEMRRADHIHLRCPGNVGLVGCFVQIFFPKKQKTAKYAGNWDPAMRKIRTYNLQRSILSNKKLSKNIMVLVYGEWPEQTKNITPFFTASYSNREIVETPPRELNDKIKCLYCGFLLNEKRPLMSVQVIERLHREGFKIELTLLGEGEERTRLEQYIITHQLESLVHLKGNVAAVEVKRYMQQSHFLTFYGHDSEGWPKVVAESMFWGCVPLVRSVSCTSYMLGGGERGTIVEDSVESMVNAIKKYLVDPEYYHYTAEKAMAWSRQYTLEKFDEEIEKFIVH
jgi:glycosyltransferase involved in cell wall biosynthesis